MITLTAYRNKKIGVFGLGKAGQGTVDALLASGAHVYAWDDKCVEDRTWSVTKNAQNISSDASLFTLHYKEWPWNELECLVLSPGVPFTHPKPHGVVMEAQKHNCRITCDIALLQEACPEARYVAITGTNGKSTTTALIHHILKQNKLKTEIGGNIGTAALSLNRLGKDGVYVLELSSYQLDLLDKPRFDVAVWLNISPDHLDRHGGMEGYVKAKQRIFSGQGKKDAAVISIDDVCSKNIAESLGAQQVIQISTRQQVRDGVYVQDGILHHAGFTCDLRGIASLTGRHNWQNAAAAYAACSKIGVKPEQIYKAMQSFPGLVHRLQRVVQIGGVWCINDSKATNAEATSHALAAFDHIYWIAGGKAKEGGIASLAEYFPRIAHAFLIGAAEEAFARTLEGKVAYTRCGDLDAATRAAVAMALVDKKPGAVVLLSPACASFDQWQNFEQRGDAFAALVSELANQKERHAL